MLGITFSLPHILHILITQNNRQIREEHLNVFLNGVYVTEHLVLALILKSLQHVRICKIISIKKHLVHRFGCV